MNALELKNISKDYENFCLNEVSFELPKGKIMGYVGQNGAGKTTTINIIMDFIKSSCGSVKVFGKTITDNEKEYKNNIGYISDDIYFFISHTAKDIDKILKSFYNSYSSEKFFTFLKEWNIPVNKATQDLSKGMKMKLMLASVLSRETKLLIMDEPTSGLDPIFRDEILDIMQEYIEDGEHSILFSTHIMSDIENVSDSICFIHDGKIELNDSVENLINEHVLVKFTNKPTEEISKHLIGWSKNKIGFKGILNKNVKVNLPADTIFETPSIEEIIRMYSKNKKNN